MQCELIEHKSFESDNYSFGGFVDISQAFHSVSHAILLKKLANYGTKGTNLT